jgi:phage terminase small subunit
VPVLSNPKHELFAQELAKGDTATDAYVKAGYKPDDGNAARLAAKPEVQARVQELTGAAAEKVGVTIERITEELAKIGFSNMLDYVCIGEDGEPRINLADLTTEQAAAIGEITINTRREVGGEARPDAEVKSVKFKLLDKRAALVDLGKHLGMFKERIEHTGKDGVPLAKELSPDEVARRVAFLLTSAAKRKP